MLLQTSNGLQGLLLCQGNDRGPSGLGLLHGWGGRGVQGLMLLRLQMLLRWSCGRSRPRGSGKHLVMLQLALLLRVVHLLVLLQMLLLLKHLLLLLGHLLLLQMRVLLLHMLRLLVVLLLLLLLLLLLEHLLLLGRQLLLLLLKRLRHCGSTLREASAVPQRDELVV